MGAHARNQASISALSWQKLKQEVKGNRKYCRLMSTCRKVSGFPPSQPPMLRMYSCERCLQVLLKRWFKEHRHRVTSQAELSSLQFTTQLITKANIKALQFANYKQDPGLVGPIRYLFLIFCVTRRLYPKLPTHLLTALRSG